MESSFILLVWHVSFLRRRAKNKCAVLLVYGYFGEFGKREWNDFWSLKLSKLAFKDHFLKTFFFWVEGDGSKVQSTNRVVVVSWVAIAQMCLRSILRFSNSNNELVGTVFMAKSWLIHFSHGQLVPCCQTHTTSNAILAWLWIVKQSTLLDPSFDNSFNHILTMEIIILLSILILRPTMISLNFLVCIIKCGLHGIIFFLSRKTIQLEILLFWIFYFIVD